MHSCKRFSSVKFRCAAVVSALAMMGELSGLAASIFVSPNGAGAGSGWNDAASLSALGTAASGDTIFIQEGTYEVASEIAIAGKTLTIQGGYGEDGSANAGESILAMTGSMGRILAIGANSVVTLEGLTFTGGKNVNGNAIQAQSADVAIRNCVFRKNESTKDMNGGAIHATQGTLTIEDTIFSHNTFNGNNGKGGAIYADRVNTLIDGCFFETNKVVANYYIAHGGALCFEKGSARILNSRFEGNDVKQQNGYTQNYNLDLGGRRSLGGSILANQMTEFEIKDCHFEGGYAGYYSTTVTDKAGGVIFLENSQNAAMTRCSVYRAGYRIANKINSFRNEGVERGDDKGSITVYKSSLYMTNVVMSCGKGNAVETIGAGAYADLENCTIAGYTGEAMTKSPWSEYTGYGLYQEDGEIRAHNTIIWGNKNGDYAYLNADGMPANQYRYCLTQSEKIGENDENNLFGVDPLFYDLQYCHLNSRKGVYLGGWFTGGEWGVGRIGSSKAIDAGDPASDVGDEPKPTVRVNLGAYGGTEVASKSMRGASTMFILQ